MKHGKHVWFVLILLAFLTAALQACSAQKKSGSGESAAYEPAAVRFSEEAGAYAGREFRLELSAPNGYTVYYTLDGSVPDRNSA